MSSGIINFLKDITMTCLINHCPLFLKQPSLELTGRIPTHCGPCSNLKCMDVYLFLIHLHLNIFISVIYSVYLVG
jgi:hypothetical protein